MHPKVSVIIPVFNAENYISSCIISLQQQLLKECEFIFVNDGSTDKTKEIISKFMVNSNNIKLINQENLGVSAARNCGMEIASGEYIGFVDADDVVANDYFLTLYTSIEQLECDVVITGLQSYEKQIELVDFPFPKNNKLNKDYINFSVMPYFIETDILNNVVNKLYKKSIIADNNVWFPLKVSLGEDGMFNLRYFHFANSAAFIDSCGYYYREVEGSATRSIGSKDYFQREVEVYRDSSIQLYLPHLNKEKIMTLKSIKFIYNVLSLTYLILSKNDKRNILKRFMYVKRMMSNASTREALLIFISNKKNDLTRYEGFLLRMIKKQNVLGVYVAVCYSKFRNR